LPTPHSFPTRRSSDLLPEEDAAEEVHAEVGAAASRTVRIEEEHGHAAARVGTHLAPVHHEPVLEVAVEGERQDVVSESDLSARRSEEHTSELQSRFDL